MEQQIDQSRRSMLQGTGAVAAGMALGALLKPEELLAAKSKAGRMAMVIDLRRCTGCRACTIACKAEYDVPLGRFSAVVKEVETGHYPSPKKSFLPRLCNHCEGTEKVGRQAVPPCVKVCPEYPKPGREKFKGERYSKGATYKRPDGLVLIDTALCVGCGKCVDACPYGARWFNPLVPSGKDKSKPSVGKCTFCAHRIDKGLVPACVNTCPGNARIFGDLEDPTSEVAKLMKQFKLGSKQTLLPEKKTLAQVFYIDPDGVLSIYHIDEKTKNAEFMDRIV